MPKGSMPETVYDTGGKLRGHLDYSFVVRCSR